MRALLVLEDGFHLVGEAFVGEGEVYGEVVFNTALSGYQEVLTDPSYYGQAVAFTYPLIGNYGVNPDDVESSRITPRAIVVREYTPQPSNYRASMSLGDWLKGSGVIGIHQIDTRALVRHLREHGAMKGIITTHDEDVASLARQAADSAGIVGQDYVQQVSTSQPYVYAEGHRYNVAVLDFGVKRSVLDNLARLGCTVNVLPASTNADHVLAEQPDAVVLSNGPGDPRALPHLVKTVGAMLGRVPMLGLGLGHQLVGQALGFEVDKLKSGHHGAGHPVKELASGKVEMTSQNHGFSLTTPGDANELEMNRPGGSVKVAVTHRSLFDGTVEGLAIHDLKTYTFQFAPEGGPGPHDAQHHFARFLERIGEDA